MPTGELSDNPSSVLAVSSLPLTNWPWGTDLPTLGDLTKANVIKVAEFLIANKKENISGDNIEKMLAHLGWMPETMLAPTERIEETWLGPALDVQMMRWWIHVVKEGTAEAQSDEYYDWARESNLWMKSKTQMNSK